MPGGGIGPVGSMAFSAPPGRPLGPGILMASFAAFGGFLFGYDTGYISGVKAMPFWLQRFATPTPGAAEPYTLSTADDSLVTSILSAGTFFGALAAYPVGDLLGRRIGIMFSCLIFSIGVAMQTAATAVPLFAVGRVFAGLGVGLVSCLVPMYQSESAPKWCRGGIVSCYQWAITIGLLIAAVVVNGTKDIDSARCYRIPIAIQFIWAAVLSGGLFWLPESPRYLILKGRDDEARRALGRLLSAPADSEEVQAEHVDIASNLELEREIGATSYVQCFRNNGPGRNALRTWTGIALQALQQLTGINFVFYFGTTFFKSAGISNPFLITVITDCVNVVFTVPGIWAVDNMGRRPLLIYGGLVMTICEFIIAIVGVTTPSSNEASQKVLIAFVCVYIAAFAATWGPIVWVMTGEIYPLAIRAKCMSLSTASNWLWNFGIAYATPYLVDSGPGKAGLGAKVFFIWGSSCILCTVFCVFFCPETKGLSLEQVDLLYQHSSIIGSNKYRRRLLAEGENHPDTREQREHFPTGGLILSPSKEEPAYVI